MSLSKEELQDLLAELVEELKDAGAPVAMLYCEVIVDGKSCLAGHGYGTGESLLDVVYFGIRQLCIELGVPMEKFLEGLHAVHRKEVKMKLSAGRE